MAENARQEINLYLPSLRPRRDLLSAHWGGLYLLLALLVFAVTGVIDLMQNRSLQQEVEQLQQQQRQLQADAQKIKAQLPKSRAQQLDKAIQEARVQVQRRQRIKGLVDAQNLGNAEGFSGQMQAMARQWQAGLALDAFTLSDGGARVGLQGQVREAVAVPRYIEGLQAESAFASSQFGVMNIIQPETGNALIFNLSPKSDAEMPAGGAQQ